MKASCGLYFHGRPKFHFAVMTLDRDHRGGNVTNKTAYGTALSSATNASPASPWGAQYAAWMNSCRTISKWSSKVS